jgi:hypothetical protein
MIMEVIRYRIPTERAEPFEQAYQQAEAIL